MNELALDKVHQRLQRIVRDYQIMKQLLRPPGHHAHLIVTKLMQIFNLSSIDTIIPTIVVSAMHVFY